MLQSFPDSREAEIIFKGEFIVSASQKNPLQGVRVQICKAIFIAE